VILKYDGSVAISLNYLQIPTQHNLLGPTTKTKFLKS